MKKKIKKAKLFSNLLLLVCVIVFCVSAVRLADYLTEAKKGEQEYSELSSVVTKKPNSRKKENPPQVDFEKLSQINSDVIGWIVIEGTAINYPIVQGEDNEIYLGETFHHKANKTGTIFLDVNNQKDFSSDNSILYGHNLKTGKMFGSLIFYEDKEYWEDHPYIWILTKEKSMKYHIYTSYWTEAAGPVYTLEFSSEEEFVAYLENSVESGYYDTGVAVNPDDTILTLSTCLSSSEEGRRVVQAKKIYEEENKR